jgi:GntR family transcriptional regulator/MocR family aminotransferase
MELALQLNPKSTEPLYQQLYSALRQKILAGVLDAGMKLPSTRGLSDRLGVSRNTVSIAYDQLISEGYLEPSRGSGTYVSKQLPDDLLQTDDSQTPRKKNGSKQLHGELGELGKLLADEGRYEAKNTGSLFPFRHGRPDYPSFPLRTWRRILFRHYRSLQSDVLDYSFDSRGYGPLREAIVGYLGRARAVQCTSDEIVIVNGSQQALDLIARILLNPGDRVAVEDPGYLGARRAFLASGASLQPVPLDDSGIDLQKLARLRNIRMAYVTPSHQFPAGSMLSLSRRLELLDWANRQKAWLIEDDYDSEYRYEGRPVPALQALDESGCVIYVGTFSKVLYPALRIGYLVVPEALVPIFRRAKWLNDRQSPMLEQYALADFIKAGYLERHIRKMRRLYDRRRRVLVESLRKEFGHNVEIRGENAGMHVLIRFKSKWSDAEMIRRAAEHDVHLLSSAEYYLLKPRRGEFIFGYANLPDSKIREGIQRLGKALAPGVSRG